MTTGEKLRRVLRLLRKDSRWRELGLYAANGAYYLFLSLGPLTALLLALLPCTPLSEGEALDVLLGIAPAPLRRLVRAVVQDVYAGSRAALGLSLALELWSGARFFASVLRGLGAVGGAKPGGYFRRRILGAAYTAVLLLFVLGNLLLLFFGRRLLLRAAELRPDLIRLWRLLLGLRPLLFFLALTGGNALLFRRTCGGGFRQVLPGAALAAAGWLGFSRIYSWALDRFGLFGVYGSIAAAAVSLYWMYGSLYLLFLGAWISTLERDQRREDRPCPGSSAEGHRMQQL